MSGLRLFRTDTTNSGMTEVMPRLAEVEADVQGLVEAHMETLLGVRFLASEYGTRPVHGGRIDSLGLDENGSPVIAEYKRGVDAGVINQGLFYLAWLMDHRAEFEHLVRDRLGVTAAPQVLWSSPRLICAAGDFTRYDVHAVREHRRSIDLVRYRFFGSDLFGLETVASVSGGMQRRRGRLLPPGRWCLQTPQSRRQKRPSPGRLRRDHAQDPRDRDRRPPPSPRPRRRHPRCSHRLNEATTGRGVVPLNPNPTHWGETLSTWGPLMSTSGEIELSLDTPGAQASGTRAGCCAVRWLSCGRLCRPGRR